MLSDLRLGFRQFARRPLLASAAVLSLALGIGANTAIFSVLNAVVLNPLPYADPDGLVVIWETQAENTERWVAPANFVDWRGSKSFASLAAFDEFSPTLDGRGEPERLRALGASGTFFTTLGVTAARGRTLVPKDDVAGAADVAVLSDGLWQRAFGASPDVVGGVVTLDGRSYTIVGVMPQGFESPLQGGAIDIFLNGDRGVPRTFPFGGDVTAVRDSHIIYVIGRLAPGVSREIAQHELTTTMEELARRYPDTNAGLGVNVKSLHEQVVGDVRRMVSLLQLAVGMMLVIACANVAHLLLGQGAARHGEMLTRAALGAARGRLVRQMLAETLVIATPGGLLGLAFAVIGLEALVAAAPQALPRVSEIGLDSTVLAFTSGLTLLTAVSFGLGPSLRLAHPASLQPAQAGLRLLGGRNIRRWHHAIVITELAMAQVLLIGAGLLLASFVASQRIPLGFATEGRVAADLNLAPGRYLAPPDTGAPGIDPTAKHQFVAAVLERLQNTPGVRAAGASFTSPLTGAPNRGFTIEGRPLKGLGREDAADFQVVTSDFFRAVGVTLVRGRGLTDLDRSDSPKVTVVNQAFVDTYFPGEEPLGRRIRFGGHLSHEIVGIVGDMRYRFLESPPDPTFYLPMSQNSERWPFMSFTVWSDGNPAATATLLRSAIRTADPHQAIIRIRSYDDIVATALATRRFNTMLVVAFAVAALVLAAVGTYGVMAYAVSVRTRELGVRAALGATPRDLLRLVFGQGALLTATAVLIGVVGGFLLTHLMSAMLFGVTPRDARTFVTVSVVLTSVALTATWLPTRRAIRINPLTALRQD